MIQAVAAPAAKKCGAKGDRGSGGGPPGKIVGTTPFYDRKRPFYRQGMPMFTTRGTLFKYNLTLRSSETVEILGFMMTNVANKAMSARNGSNETLLTTSYSDMSHEACSRDCFEKFLHNVKLQFLRQAIS